MCAALILFISTLLQMTQRVSLSLSLNSDEGWPGSIDRTIECLNPRTAPIDFPQYRFETSCVALCDQTGVGVAVGVAVCIGTSLDGCRADIGRIQFLPVCIAVSSSADRLEPVVDTATPFLSLKGRGLLSRFSTNNQSADRVSSLRD